MRQACKYIRQMLGVTGLLLGVGLLASSCVKDNRSGCEPPTPPQPATLKLMFIPQPDAMKAQIGSGDMKRGVVWIFDSKGAVQSTWSVANPQFNVTYDTKLSLADIIGHRVVGWINPDAPYTVSGVALPAPTRAAVDDARLALTVPASGVVTTTIPKLLYGKIDTVVEPGSDMTIKIPFVLDTYDLTVKVEGLPRDGSTYAVEVEDDNVVYDFANNMPTPFTKATYQGKATIDNTPGGGTGEVTLSVRTLRIGVDGHKPKLRVVKINPDGSRVPIYPDAKSGTDSVDLIDKIKSVEPNYDFSTQSTVNIAIKVTPTSDGTGFTVDVWINGWHLVEGEPQPLIP